MNSIFKAKSYWIISGIGTIIIFMAMFGLGKIYKSETDILISPKNPRIEKNISEVIENIQQISKSLIFYNNILKYNREIKDQAANLSDSEKKSYWNSIISSKRVNDSNIIRFSIEGKNESDTEQLANGMNSELSWEINKYYSTDTDIDVKIVEGPIIGQSKKYNNGILFLISFLISFLAVYLSYGITSLFQKNSPASAEEKFFSIPRKETAISPEKEARQREAQEKLNKLLNGYS